MTGVMVRVEFATGAIETRDRMLDALRAAAEAEGLPFRVLRSSTRRSDDEGFAYGTRDTGPGCEVWYEACATVELHAEPPESPGQVNDALDKLDRAAHRADPEYRPGRHGNPVVLRYVRILRVEKYELPPASNTADDLESIARVIRNGGTGLTEEAATAIARAATLLRGEEDR